MTVSKLAPKGKKWRQEWWAMLLTFVDLWTFPILRFGVPKNLQNAS
jgi:hypothetical protein